jgi:hypothetical protein
LIGFTLLIVLAVGVRQLRDLLVTDRN